MKRLKIKVPPERVVFLLLFVATILLLFNINKPFVGHHDWNGAFWGGITRNYLDNLSKFLGFTIGNTSDHVTDGEFIFFYHYTPLMPLLFTFSAAILGFSEMSLRLSTVFFSIIMLFFIYKIGEELYTKRVGVIAMALAMATPMFLYFGKLPDHEPILTSLCTISFYFYIRLKKKNVRERYLFFLFLTLTLLESWGGFFLLGFMVVHSLLSSYENRSFVIKIISVGIAVILFQFILIIFFHGKETLVTFVNYGLARMSVETSQSNIVRFTLPQFLLTEARYLTIYFTKILLVLSGLWGIWALLRLKRGVGTVDLTLGILFFYGAFFVLFFRNLSYIHDYKLYLLLPFMAISGAWMTEIIAARLFKKRSFLKIIIVIILVVGVFTERWEYLRTLIFSSFDRPGYTLGQYIQSLTIPSEKTLVLSEEFDRFYGVFVRYYANRKVNSVDLRLSNLQKNPQIISEYRYVVVVDKRPVDNSLVLHLRKTYSLTSFGDYMFIDLEKEL
ncbi:glycosyltransferase family 39 protein [Candidatus Gottesmanbacteria bacterium]|nr:glycosyltransferase family 39 protein [Candidatus Gottesmanbacteria bacterium]